MPRPDRYLQLLAEPVQATKLVVDERFQRADVDNQPGLLHGKQIRQRGQKGCLRFAGCGCRGHDDITVAFDNEWNRLFLCIPQGFPAFCPDEALDAFIQLIEGCAGSFVGHWSGLAAYILNDANSSSSSPGTNWSPVAPVSTWTSMPPNKSCQVASAFCSRTASKLTKAVMVVRGVRK